MTGEIIVVEPYAYVRGYGETKYSMEGSSALFLDPASASGPWSIIQKIVDVADDPRLTPTLVGTEQEPTGPCYHIQVKVTPEVVSANLGLTNQLIGTGTLDMWIYTGSLLVERIQYQGFDPHVGVAGVRMVMTSYNAVGQIKAPPLDQYEIPALQSIGQ